MSGLVGGLPIYQVSRGWGINTSNLCPNNNKEVIHLRIKHENTAKIAIIQVQDC